MEELDNIVCDDLWKVNPQLDITVKCPHQAIRYKKYDTYRDVDFNCNVATRYYEDKKYARAYALSPYQNGVAIIANKKYDEITILILGEDDGNWFVKGAYNPYWIKTKVSFISLVSEALSIFNNNYKET